MAVGGGVGHPEPDRSLVQEAPRTAAGVECDLAQRFADARPGPQAP
jgi:hypothetical protein